jgi:hypothetical protein
LPRGQTFIVEPAYTSSGERVLERVCSQLKIDKDKYFLQGFGQVSNSKEETTTLSYSLDLGQTRPMGSSHRLSL